VNRLLDDKIAVVYGAGSIGGAVAQAFAREGAQVFLGSRSAPAPALVERIVQDGGIIETAEVDALDKQAVDSFVDAVVKKTGRLDVSFNAINVRGGEQGVPLKDLNYEDFALPITAYTKTQFLTATAAAPQMIEQGGGVIMMVTAFPSRTAVPYTAGFAPAWAAIEAFARTLAAEHGRDGIRTVCLSSTGSPDAAESIQKTYSSKPGNRLDDAFHARLQQQLLLPKLTSLEDVGNMAAFMASDKAGATTGAIANLTCGLVTY
jgi:3-oxoacyl-[acyl-carrier protein] reductase